MLTASLLWFAAGVALCILEMLVPVGAFLVFAAGCCAGWLAALADASLNAQILAAVAGCILALLVLRRRLARIFSGQSRDSEQHSSLEGLCGTVTVPMSPGVEGQVDAGGSFWRAVSDEGAIRAGEQIRIVRVDAMDTQLLHVQRLGSDA